MINLIMAMEIDKKMGRRRRYCNEGDGNGDGEDDNDNNGSR